MQIDRSLNYKLSNNVINTNNNVNKINSFVLSTKRVSDIIVLIFTNCLTTQ